MPDPTPNTPADDDPKRPAPSISLADLAELMANPRHERKAARMLAQAVTSGYLDIVGIDYALLAQTINGMLKSPKQRVRNSGVRAALVAGIHNAQLLRLIDQAQQRGLVFTDDSVTGVRRVKVEFVDSDPVEPAQAEPPPAG